MSTVSVKINEQKGEVASVSVLAESDDAVVFLIDLTMRAKRARLIIQGGDSWRGWFDYDGADLGLPSIEWFGLERLGDRPIEMTDTNRYTCVVTFVRCHEGRELYMFPCRETSEVKP